MGNKEQKLTLFAEYVIIYVENSITSTEKLPELIAEFSKVAWYKSQLFLYILIMKNQKLKLKTSIYNDKKYEILRCETDKRCEKPVYWKLQNIADRN